MAPRITERPLDVAEALDEVAGSGAATCLFAGTVRAVNEGRRVVSLGYEAHRPLGRRVLRELEEEAEGDAAVRRCRIAHRVGRLDVGEISVLVAVAADGHEAAVEAARRAMRELKERLPMWKEERYADGESRYLDGSPLRPDGPGGAASEDGADGGAPAGGRPPDGSGASDGGTR